MTNKFMLALIWVVFAAGLLIQPNVSAYHSYELTVKQLKAGLDKSSSSQSKGFFLIDVRSPGEHSSGVIPGTDMNIEFREIGDRHREIGAKLDDHIVVYCQSGKRSNIAAETLASLGYKYVYNVRGSINAWTEAGYPIVPAKDKG